MSYCCDVTAYIEGVKDGVQALKVCRDYDEILPVTLNFHVSSIPDEFPTITFHGDHIEYHREDWIAFATALAPFINDDIIEFTGEGGVMWGFYFENGKFYEYEPIVVKPKGRGMDGFKEAFHDVFLKNINLI